jgi:hypothetical protein
MTSSPEPSMLFALGGRRHTLPQGTGGRLSFFEFVLTSIIVSTANSRVPYAFRFFNYSFRGRLEYK